ncbi:MAG: hypothetical protein ACRD12_11170 [Acidimicrobiales bacterium]
MDLIIAAAKPWTYWLALPLAVATVLAMFAILLRYLLKAVAAKYPRQ